jgi:hypothetical protein
VPVAIKTVLFQDGAGDDVAAAMEREASIAAALHHPNIIATFAHDAVPVAEEPGREGYGAELGIFKFYLIQARFDSAWFDASLPALGLPSYI